MLVTVVIMALVFMIMFMFFMVVFMFFMVVFMFFLCWNLSFGVIHDGFLILFFIQNLFL